MGRGAAPDAATGVRYTVFGCGNRDWAATYQAVPTLIDDALEARGATRVYPRGEGDAAATSTPPTAPGTPGCGTTWRRRSGCRPRWRPAAPAGPRLSITLTNRQVANPVILSYRGPARDGAGQPRADRARGHARAGARCATSRSRCPPA